MQPVWACGSTIGIANFPIIERISTLHILGENDAASDAAILACGERWRRAGKKVHAWFPEHGGDFNDELLERLKCPHRIAEIPTTSRWSRSGAASLLA
jgi:hypothetical protein